MISSGKLAVYEQMKKMERMERELAEVTVETSERERRERQIQTDNAVDTVLSKAKGGSKRNMRVLRDKKQDAPSPPQKTE